MMVVRMAPIKTKMIMIMVMMRNFLKNIKNVIMAMRMMRMRRNVMIRRRKTTMTTYHNYTWQPLYPAIVPAPPLVTKPHVFFPFCQ